MNRLFRHLAYYVRDITKILPRVSHELHITDYYSFTFDIWRIEILLEITATKRSPASLLFIMHCVDPSVLQIAEVTYPFAATPRYAAYSKLKPKLAETETKCFVL